MLSAILGDTGNHKLKIYYVITNVDATQFAVNVFNHLTTLLMGAIGLVVLYRRLQAEIAATKQEIVATKDEVAATQVQVVATKRQVVAAKREASNRAVELKREAAKIAEDFVDRIMAAARAD